ncbi:MAG: alpha-amylase family glycosyl hydrolase [Fusobacterium sp.]|nr:alpha-amylase family glycosyl hydrolase [Fusobacterium sp.]
MKKTAALLLGLFVFSMNSAFADRVWINDLRTRFLNNSAIIMEINPRTFNAHDTDGDGLIKKADGDESGNFLNGIARLDSIGTMGVNTVLLMPVNQIGKIKALGTAGSLYAISDFSKINPQLVSGETVLSDIDQAKKFVKEAHNRNLRVMVDLPACGAYDLYMKRPELFAKDKNGQAIVPDIWTDVRLFNAGTEENYNKDVFALYKDFVDLMLELEVDGIRANVPSIKPASFWRDLISYSRKFDQQMLWLAQANDNGVNVLNTTINTPTEKLLEAGFDGYYGNINELKDAKNAKDFSSQLSALFSNQRKRTDKKAVLGAFSTHDDLSPMLSKGMPYTVMQYWLNATLPVNSFVLDGNQSGDNFVYGWGNKKATESDTDDMQYFVNRGKIDIFNYSRRPGAGNPILFGEFVMSNQFKKYFMAHLNAGTYHILKTTHPDIFAYAISYNRTTIVVMGNINFTSYARGDVKLSKFDAEKVTVPVKITEPPLLENGKITINLNPGELQILVVSDYEL